MASNVEKIVEGLTLGEGPHWDAETNSLYFVDLFDHFIHKYDPASRRHTKAYIGKDVSIIIPVKDKNDEFVISYGREIVSIRWDGTSDKVKILERLYEVDPNTNNVFNDGKCDPSGRLWAGSIGASVRDGHFPDERASLFSFQNGKVTTHLTNIGISNGLAFNESLNKFYYVDSLKGTLDQYDFDIVNGKISNGKPIYTLNEQRGFGPSQHVLDGMTIDTEGNLWVAVFNESKVIKIDPRKPGVVAESVQIPAKQITSVTFGGPNLDELYVTSGRLPMLGEIPSSPDDGATYRVSGLKAKGLPGVRIVI